jgi:hypothetical protein
MAPASFHNGTAGIAPAMTEESAITEESVGDATRGELKGELLVGLELAYPSVLLRL